ncbi:MAG: chorismate mutase, partial [Acidobacteria bacterium]|nr:chorismate mutase [Acidobacteriota bacterium]
MDRLADFRRRIDDIDEQLVKLLNVRASIALEIGRIKHANSEPIYQPGRARRKLKSRSKPARPQSSARAPRFCAAARSSRA